jgi:hypothetical protein
MINRILASATLLLAGTFCGVAQATPGQPTVGSTVTVQEFRSVVNSESSSWGDYQEFGFDVNTGSTGATGVTLDLDSVLNFGGGLDVSAGGSAGFSAYTLTGGFTSDTNGWTNITGQSVTAESFFK